MEKKVFFGDSLMMTGPIRVEKAIREAFLEKIYDDHFVFFVIFFRILFLLPGVRKAIFKNFPERKTGKWPAPQPASGTG